MLIEKEIIAPGEYWYIDETTKLPRVLNTTSDMTKYWADQGNAMLASGLTVPVPYEHDFKAHPMTPKEQLLNNAGWVKEYRIKDAPDPVTKEVRKDVLFGVVDIEDEDVKKKLPTTIRWTSPWINSFTDGQGKQWNNVISHLALTTRPRITKQSPFPNIAAALSLATPTEAKINSEKDHSLFLKGMGKDGFSLSRAGILLNGKPRFPIAFSMMGGGISLSEKDIPPKKDKKPAEGKKPPESEDKSNNNSIVDSDDEDDDDVPDNLEDGDPSNNNEFDNEDPLGDAKGDLKMEEILCHLLQALGVPMPDSSNPAEFHRHLYEAAMSKIKELTSMGMGKEQKDKFQPDQNKPPKQQPNASQPNPIIGQVQQEQQPMYMGLNMSTPLSLEDINKIPDATMKQIALSMYTENQSLQAKLSANEKVTNSLRDKTLKEAQNTRQNRIAILSRISPKVKDDLEKMVALPTMALSMGDAGEVIDPMGIMLDILEKGLPNLPKLMTTDNTALSVQPQPSDGDKMTAEREDEIADGFARQMGCPPLPKKAS